MHKKEIKKILLFTSQLFPSTGGFSQVVNALAGGMRNFGFSTQLLAPIDENIHLPPYPLIPVRFFHNLYPLITDYRSRYERIMEMNLEILYQKNPFDMIHAHFAYPAGFCAARWGQQKGIPVIITCHGHDINNLADKPYEHDTWEKLQAKMIEGFALANKVTVPSRDMVEQLKSWGVDSRRIPNGIHLNQIPQHQPQNDPFILTIGRFNKVKGFDMLFKTFAILAPKHPNLKLVVFGEGCGKLHFFNKTLSNELTGRVLFTGSDEKKKWELIRQCQLYVCPSRREGFGIAVLEAMAAGKPVVAFDVGGVKDLVENENNGILVPPYDIVAMAEGISRILADRTSAKKMSDESVKRAADFNWPIILEQYQQLYHEVLG